MAQINLLSSETQRNPGAASRKLLTMVMRVLVFVLLFVLALYAYFWIANAGASSALVNTQKQIDQVQTQLSANKDRSELLTRQAQLKSLETLIKGHEYWSNTLPDLAKATLTGASYLSIDFKSDGETALQVTVPSYADLDKFLQVFNRPEFNKDFSDVQIKGVSKAEKDNTLQLSFNISLKYNTDSIRFDSIQSASNPAPQTAQ